MANSFFPTSNKDLAPYSQTYEYAPGESLFLGY